MTLFDQELLLRRKRRYPDPYRVLYMDMETLRAGKIRNWDNADGTRDGTINGMTIAGTGMPAKSGFFDGNDYVTIGAFGLSGTALTFAAWIRCAQNATITQTFIGDNAGSTTVGWLHIYRDAAQDNIKLAYANGSAVAYANAASFFTGYDNTWVHATVVCDYAGATCKFYRNGTLHTNAGLSGTPVFPSTSRTRYLGAYNSTPSYPLTNGYIDEVQLWTRALTDAEVLAQSRLLPARG
jgi:hypothetical protein